MAFLLDHLTPATFDTQRRVVANELRENKDAPYGVAGDADLDAIAKQWKGWLIGDLVYSEPLATDVDGQHSMKLASVFDISIDAQPDTDFDKVIRIVDHSLEVFSTGWRQPSAIRS